MQKAGAFCAWGPARDAGGAAQRGAGPFEGWYKALEDRIWLTQLGQNILLPLVLCLGGCCWAGLNFNRGPAAAFHRPLNAPGGAGSKTAEKSLPLKR